MLLQKATKKALTDTNLGKKISSTIKKRSISNPQDVNNIPLTWEGVTSLSYLESKKKEFSDISSETSSVFGWLKDEIEKSFEDNWINSNPFKSTSTGFKLMEEEASDKVSSAMDYRDTIFSSTKWDIEAKSKLRKTLWEKNFNKFSDWLSFVNEAETSVTSDKKEWQIRWWFASAARALPFWEPILDPISKATGKLAAIVAEKDLGARRLPSFSEVEFAKQKAASEWKYDLATEWRVVWTIWGTLLWYYGFGKVVDKALLSTNTVGKAKVFQDTLKESYARNPFLFNLTSNSAQEAIEYWVRKWLWDEDYSVGDLALWLITWGVASKLFSSKLDSVFDNITQKDLDKINSTIEQASKANPEASSKELMESVGDVKLTNWMTFKDLKSAFIRAWGSIAEKTKTTPEAVTSFFRSAGTNISSGASKRFASAIEEVNSIIKKQKKSQVLSEAPDISLFKKDVLAELGGKTNITKSDIDEVLTRKTKEYGIELKNDKYKTNWLDETEELVMKEDVEVSTLANPKTIEGFKSTYMGIEDFNIDRVNKLMDEVVILEEKIKKNPLGKGVDTHRAKLASAKAQLDEFNVKYNVKNTRELIDKKYNISEDEVSTFAKSNRKAWAKWRVTIEEKNIARDKIIEETIKLEKEADKIIKKLSGLKSIDRNWDFSKIAQFAQLRNGLTNWNYRWTLKSFIANAKQIIDDKGLWMNGKEVEKMRLQSDVRLIEEDFAKNNWEKFSLGRDERLTWKWQIFNAVRLQQGKWLSYVDSYYRVFRRIFWENSHIMKVLFNNIDWARSTLRIETDEWEASLRKLAENAWLEDYQTQRKFMIAMTWRQWGWVEDSITKADNLWIDNTWKIWDDEVDIRFNWELKRPTWQVEMERLGIRKLNEDDIRSIITDIETRKSMRELISVIDNKMRNTWERLIQQHYRDSGVLFPTEDKYFPLIYSNRNYSLNEQDDALTLGNMFDTHVYQGFLNARKTRPVNFSLNTDFFVFMDSFAKNQLYYLHMKNPIMRAKRAIRWANTNWGMDIEYDKMGNPKLVDIPDGDNSPFMTPELKKYVDGYIRRMENRGQIKAPNLNVIRALNNAVTYKTIATNIWSIIAQIGSKFDAIWDTWKINWAKSWVTVVRDWKKGFPALKYSGALRERFPETLRGLSERGWFLNLQEKDLRSLSQGKSSISNKVLNVLMRAQKRLDWEMSYSVWSWYFADFVKNNYPQYKYSMDIDYMNSIMKPIEFRNAVEFANRRMVNTMGASSEAFTFGSQAEELGVFFKSWTLIQKTFINRMLLLNDWMLQWKVPSTLLVLWIWQWVEMEREYLMQRWRQLTWRKEFKETWSHLGNIIANNPSLDPESFINSYYAKLVDAKNWEQDEEITRIQTLGALAFVDFVSNVVFNPVQWDKVSQVLWGSIKWLKKWYNYLTWEQSTLPENRARIEAIEWVSKALLPSFGWDIVDVLHSLSLAEPLWETTKDNKALQSILKATPEKIDVLNKMDFEMQSEEAWIKRWIDETTKALSDRDKEISKKKDDIMRDVFSIYWVPTKEELLIYARENREAFKAIWITKVKQLDSLISSVDDYGRRITSWEASLIPKNIEVIYEYKLKSLAEKWDREWVNQEIRNLVSSGVIKDKNAALKKVKWFLKRDWLLWY